MGSSRFVRKVAIGLLASGTVIGLTAAAGAASAAPQVRHPLDGSMPKWLHQARDMGASSTAQRMNFGVLLGMRDQAGAMDTLKAISDPASSSYGKWLTNAQFDARYAPAKSSVTAVQDWLRSEGFQVTKTLPSGMYVEASGSVAKVESAFGTSVHNYSYLGKDVHANNSQLSLPSGTPAAISDRRPLRPGQVLGHRGAGLAPLGRFPGHQDPAQRDVRGGQRFGRQGGERLRHERAQLLLPR